MTAADFKTMSIGFVIDFCVTKLDLETNNLNSDEEKYHKLKDILPFVKEDYESGKIDKNAYIDFMADFNLLEEKYGWDY